MRTCKSVTLRSRDRRNGTKSLFLDFYPGYRDPETMELIRRRSLGLYIYKNPKNDRQKEFNEKVLEKAEAIRCKIYLDIIDDKFDFFKKDKMKESFLAYFETQITKDKTKKESAYKHFSLFVNGVCTFEDIDIDLCHKFHDYLMKAERTGNSTLVISQNTASAYWKVFRSILHQAYKERRLRENFSELLDAIPTLPTVKEYLTLAELREVYATDCDNPAMKKAIVFSCLSGLRLSDILNLKWKDVRTYADGGHYLDFECIKTKRQTIVPIGQEAYDLILPRTSGNVFEGFTRNMANNDMQKWLLEEVGITKHITFHCFRHTYATLQIELGTDIYTVQHLLSHRNVSTTQIYASHADPKTREAANRIRLTEVKKTHDNKEKKNTEEEK